MQRTARCSCPSTSAGASSRARPHVHIDRHGASTGRQLSFSCYNVRSLCNKIDALLDVRRDLSLDVMCLVET